MKSSLLVHGMWGVLAIASFVLGSQLFPVGEGSSGGRTGSGGGSGGGKSWRSPEEGPAGQAGAGRESGQPTTGKGMGASGRGRGLGQVTLSEQDVQDLGEQFRTSANPIERRLAFSRLLEGLTPENAELVRKQIEHLPAEAAEFREFHYAWGAVGGVDAVFFGADTPKADMSPALAGWASANPTEAMKWFEGLDMENDSRFDNLLKDRKIPAAGLRSHLLGGLVDGLADADPDAAARFVAGLAAAGETGMERMMGVVVGAVLQTSTPAAAAIWSEGLPPGELRNAALGRVAGQFANTDPEGAAEWAVAYADQPEANRVIGEVGSRWARREPEAAIAWLEELPASGGRSYAIGSAFSTWAERNPEVAGNYIVQMAPSPERDSAITGFANRLAYEDPATGVQWAASVSDPEARERALVRTGQTYFRRNATAAQEWLATSGLSSEAQQQVLNPPRQRDWRGRR